MFCPNYKIKEVFDGFNEMIEALGGKPMTEEEFRSSELRNQRTGQNYSAMESAYKMYHRNNGNMPDTAPNGKHSILFDSLLELFNGDRKAAIEAKSKVYSTNFLNWFGDWINDSANASKVVDENGEPLVVYHHTDNPNLTEFITDFENYFTKDGGTKEAMFFDENETGTLGRKYDISVFLNIKDLNEYNETKQQLHDRGTTYREVVNQSAEKNNKDGGVHMKDFDDNKMEHQSIWIVHNPNQIKSAVGNSEEFSTTNDNIYFQENQLPGNVKKQYVLDYNTELKLQETKDFNPFGYFKNRNYFVLGEKSSAQFEKYRAAARKHRKDDKKYGYPSQFFDEATNVLYIKSNNRKNSRKYDAVYFKTGEVIRQGVTLFTYDEFEESKYRVSQKERVTPKTFSPARAINFALLRQMPSKERYKSLAKQFVYDSVTPEDNTVNFKIIDKFIESMPDALWDYISTDVYGFNEDIYIGPFKVDTSDTSNITAATSKINSSDIKINLPKLGLIKMVEEVTGVKLLGRKVKFNARGIKMPNKNRQWNEEVTLDNNLTRPEIEYLIRNILGREYFKSSTEKENILYYAKHHGLSVDDVYETMRLNRETDDMSGAKSNERIRNYDWQWAELTEKVESKWNSIVTEYLNNRYKDAFTKNDIPYLNLYFKGIMPWIKIDFNLDSGTSPEANTVSEPFIRLASVIHEPFHALHALSYGSKEELELREAYKKLISTPFGKKLYDLTKNTLSENTTDDGIYKELCAYMFLLINTPSELRGMEGDQFLSTKLYDYIKSIVELPVQTATTTVLRVDTVTTTEEYEIKLNFAQKLYNFIVSALHKMLPLMKQYVNLIDTVGTREVSLEVVTEEQVTEETLSSKTAQALKKNFLDRLTEFEDAIKVLLNVDGNVLSSLNVNEFFNKKSSFKQESGERPISESQNITNESIARQMYEAAEQIENEREAFVRRLIDQYKLHFPDAEQKDISRVANNSRNQFNEEQANKLMYQHLQLIAESFGLSINSKGFYESSEEGLKKLMLEYFVNSMQEDTFNLYSLEDLGKDKYQQAGRVQNVGSVDSAIYHAIYNGNLRTLDKVLARDYVRMFWKSDLIQASLKVLDTGNKTSLELEDALVDNITREEPSKRDTKITKWFKDFWDRLSKLIKSVFDGEELSESQKNRILKAVDAAYMLSQDLKQTREESGILDRAEGDMSSSQYLSARDKQVFQSIKQGIKTRFKSHVSRNIKDENLISDLKLRLEIIDQRDEDSVDDVFNTVQDFLVKATMEIGKTEYEIDDKILSKDISEWDPQEINFILYDLLGYYENMLAVVSDLFSDPMSSVAKFNAMRLNLDPNAVDLKNTLRLALNDLNRLKETYQRRVVMKYVKYVITDFVNRSETIKDKPTFIYNTIKQLEQDAAYGDISASEVVIGMASRSGSSVVRILEKMVSSTEFLTHRLALKKANELMLKYKEVLPFGQAIDPRNWQKRFMEFDDKGIPTGLFIRDTNYGQFYRNKDAKEQELRIKYKLQADEDGDTIFPEEDYTANNSTYNRYYDELDKWLDENCNRRYTLEYYKQKRRFLSPDTIKALNKIQRRIDLLLDSVRTKGGYIDKSKLTPNQKLQLDKFRKEKRDLGIAYVITETADGVLKFERKTGAGERMADEISAWNAHVRDKIKYKPDLDKFEKAKQELKDSGATEEELNAFELSNTSLRITEDFYNLLFDVVGKSATTPELEKLKRRHSQILSVLKERQGAGSQKLSRLGFGLNTDTSGWKELQYLEQRMADIRKNLRSKGVHGESPKNNSLSFDQIASMMPVALSDKEQDKTFLTYLINKWQDVIVNKNEMLTVFDNLFRYKDEKGVYRYLKAFDYLTPKDYTLTVDGRTIKCLERLPISEYSELDKANSAWVNDDFVDDGPSMQPKEMYKNAAYLDLTEEEHKFLDLLVSTMEEANSMIPKKAKNRDYLLPQMSGRTTSVMSNMIQTKNILDAVKYPFRDFSNSYAETDSDASTNADLPRRPDGSVVNNIPVRFVDRLKDPKAQSTDVLGSVIIFYEMALNYANKSKNLPTLELIKYATRPEMSNTFRAENQYKKIENILDQRYYGKETTFGFSSNEKITPGKQRTIQITKTVRNKASIAMLGVNMFTIGVGFADASISVLADTIGGKYLTGSDLRFALSEMTRNLPAALSALGSASSDNKALAAMRYNKLSTSNAELFGNSDMSRVTRLFKKYLLMGGYTLSDYTINSLILYATYHHYRLVTDPRGKRKFCSKTDAINMFTKYGYSEPEAISMWENSEKTLWDAYTCEKGEFKVSDEYKDIVTRDLEDNIAGRVEDRTAVYNGVVPLSQKAKLQQNVFGSYLTLMRGFYVNSYWERFHGGADRVRPEELDHEVHWYSGFTKDNAGRENLETGEFDGALFVDFCRGVYKLASNLKNILRGTEKNKLTSNLWYAVRRCGFELAMIGFLVWQMLWSVFFARVNNYDDDKDPAWIINLTGPNKGIHINTNNIGEKFADYRRWAFALFSTRLFTERIGMWYPGTFLDIITSVSSAESFLDDVGSIFSLTVDLFSQRSDDEVLRGGYSHMTRGTRDILKLLAPLGLDNIVRQGHTEGVKATLNYYKGLAPTKYIVPSLAEFNESQGLNSHGAKPKKRHNSNAGEFAD